MVIDNPNDKRQHLSNLHDFWLWDIPNLPITQDCLINAHEVAYKFRGAPLEYYYD